MGKRVARSKSALGLREVLAVVVDLLFSPEAALAYAAYFVGAASPGPSNLAIMSIAMREGRRAALVFAVGVVCGAAFWAVLAALGLSAVLATWSQFLIAMKIAGGLYLLWLAVRSARSALRRDSATPTTPAAGAETPRRFYLRGVAMHLTNPKAIFVWMSIVSLSLPANAGAAHALTVAGGCLVVAVGVFGGYALLFSMARVRRGYLRVRRWFDGVVAAAFAAAGIKLLAGARA